MAARVEGATCDADVLKVPHHGAATSVPEFFEAVEAEVAVVSVGDNDYGHPTAFTLDALAASGAQVWRTDRHGTITVSFAGLDADGRVRAMAVKTAPPVTLLWGEDDFLLREAALAILGDTKATEVDAAAVGGRASSRVSRRRRSSVSLGRLLVNDAKSLRKETLEEIARYLDAPDPDATLVLSCVVAERGKVPAGLQKLVEPVGEVRKVDIARRELEPWLVARAKAARARPGDPRAPARSSRHSAPSPVSWSRRSNSSRTRSPASASDLVRSPSSSAGLGEQKTWDLCDRAFGKDLPGAIRSLRSIEEGGDEALMVLGGHRRASP